MLPYVAHDPRFERLVFGHVNLEKLTNGDCRWAEGPAYFPAGRYLVWSDIPNNRMMRFDETDGSVSVFRAPSFNSNGNTIDRAGPARDLRASAGGASPGPSTTARSPCWRMRSRASRFNSPNDVVVKSDNSIWFTDPTYGIDTDYEGAAERSPRSAPPTSTASTAAPARSRASCPTGCSPTGWRSRRTKPCSTSPTPARRMSAGFRRRSGPIRSRDRRSEKPRCSPPARTGCMTASVATSMATSGRRRAAACSATRRRHASRYDRDRRDRRQCLLRRPAPRPPLHLRTDLAVFDLPQHTGRGLSERSRPSRTCRVNS